MKSLLNFNNNVGLIENVGEMPDKTITNPISQLAGHEEMEKNIFTKIRTATIISNQNMYFPLIYKWETPPPRPLEKNLATFKN